MIRNFLVSKMTRERLDPFIDSLSSSLYTLDIGCANSPYSGFFPKRLGFDILPGEGVDVVGDAHELPFPNETFEQILCTEVLEHLHTPHLALSEMHRVLKPGGKLILTTRFLFPIHDAPGDYFRFTKYGLQHLLRNWKNVTIKEEVSTSETFGVLLQRIAFQTEMRGGNITKAFILLLARCTPLLKWFIKKEYGMKSKVGVREEHTIMTSGYHVIAEK